VHYKFTYDDDNDDNFTLQLTLMCFSHWIIILKF